MGELPDSETPSMMGMEVPRCSVKSNGAAYFQIYREYDSAYSADVTILILSKRTSQTTFDETTVSFLLF